MCCNFRGCWLFITIRSDDEVSRNWEPLGARRADGFLREMPLEEVEENLPSTRHQNQAVFEVFLGVSNAEG